MPRPPALAPAAAPEPTLELRIGEVARRSGVSVKTIRFYCDQGLLRPSGRSAGGYRLFSPDTLAELVIIRALRAMDVSIAELARILQVRRAGVCNCALLKTSIAAKLDAIDRRLEELVTMKGELARLLQGWQDCGGIKDGPAGEG